MVDVSFTNRAASSGEYKRSASIFSAAARYALLRFIICSISITGISCLQGVVHEPRWLSHVVIYLYVLSGNRDAHLTCSALDDLHRGIDVVCIEVGHLGLSDFANLGLGNASGLH